jgi:hypothetical protein
MEEKAPRDYTRDDERMDWNEPDTMGSGRIWLIALIAGVLVCAIAVLLTFEAEAQERVDNAVVFLADISSSMDDEELEIVRASHAYAIRSAEVLGAIEQGAYQKSAFAYIEFGRTAEVVIGWTIIHDRASAVDFASRIMAPRTRNPAQQTAVGDALFAASHLIISRPFEASFLTVDVVGDGASNTGMRTEIARDLVLGTGATINAMPLMIRSATVGLDTWFEANVMGGPRSFLIPLHDIKDMPLMLRRKLVMELY